MKLNRRNGSLGTRISRQRLPRIALAALFAVAATLSHPTPALAEGEYIVERGLNNPANTTVDLFDYWITSQAANDRTQNSFDQGADAAGYYQVGWGGPFYVANQGINENHALIFHGGAGGSHPGDCASDIFTEQIGPYGTPSLVWGPVAQGLVKNTLGSDGYPVLNGQYQYTNSNPFLTINHSDSLPGSTRYNTFSRFNLRDDTCDPNESLNYLFNPNTSSAQSGSNYVAGKAVYPDVNGLFSVDSEGFYVYDSARLRANYNGSQNRFDLIAYDEAGGAYPDGHTGFWPLDDDRSGVQYQATNHNSHNDYLGMHMQMEFSMPEGGYVLNPQGEYVPMTFTFSGDDDVWVYVDGVLVGDVGGIHQPSSLMINFQTGEVSVNQNFAGVYTVTNPRGSGNPEYVETTYLDVLFAQAGMSGATSWNGHAFADGTYHTIDFFYLERGNNESNLDIRFNMINTADFTAHKALVTDPRRPLQHDEFKFDMIGYDGIYTRDENGNVVLIEGTENTDALMPKGASAYTTPQEAGNGDVSRSFRDEGDKWVYRVGVAADGNVNFGNADFDDSTSPGHIYRYKVEEVLPEGATYDETTGIYTFTHDGQQFYCPRTVYYVQAEVRRDESDGSLYLSKRYFVDDTYEVEYETNFASFHDYNYPLTPVKPNISAQKRLLQGAAEMPLSAVNRDFTFELTNADGSRTYAQATAEADGSVTFELPNITHADFVHHVVNDVSTYDPLVRTYTIREVLPDGAVYNEDDDTYTYEGVQYDRATYTVTVTATCDNAGQVTIQSVEYETDSTPTFTNRITPKSIEAQKVWDDSAAGEGATANHPSVVFRVCAAENFAEEGEDPEWVPIHVEVPASYADDKNPHDLAEDKTIPANATGDDLKVKWENLLAMDDEGNEIHYVVVEGVVEDGELFIPATPNGYVSETSGNEEDGFTITNVLQPLSLVVTKLAGPEGQETHPLQGAGFTMTRMNPETDPLEPYAPEHDLFFEQVVDTNENGKATFGDDGQHKLYAGTYRISETRVPAGYQQAADVFITITADGTATISGQDVTYDPMTRTLSMTITNTELPDLPATGGPGDTMLLVSGAALIVAALAILTWSERRLAL